MKYTGRRRNFAVTTCNACYFSNVKQEIPQRCLRRTCRKQFFGPGAFRCLRRFGNCVDNNLEVITNCWIIFIYVIYINMCYNMYKNKAEPKPSNYNILAEV